MSKQKNELVPELRFPEFMRSPGWDAVYGNKAFEQVSNKDHNSDLPILAITQEYGAIPREIIDYNVSVTEKSVQSYKVVDVGDFIISLRSFQGGIEYSEYKGLCSPAYVILRNKRDIDKRFFKQYFKAKSFIRDLTKNLEGLRDGKMISYNQFSEVLLPKPSPEEQRKIANCLASIDELITLHTQKLDALKDYKKGLMQQLFPVEGETVPKLRFPEFQDKGEWVKKPFERVIEIASGQVDPTKSPYCDMPHIGGENIESDSGKILNVSTAKDLNLISGKYAFDESYILYSKIRPALNKVARPNFKGICSADIYPIRPATDELLLVFLNYILLSKKFLDHAKKHSDRGKIPKVNREAVMAYIASLPAPDEQYRIANFLCSIDELLASQTLRVGALRAHKNGLMQKLFPVMDEVV
ncbi:restriction endonuclease subunit S [Salmonella enterica subsp. enterica serovar Glostrup]|nr:restriction endonuclease subunit S [Salmonella enterica]EDQ7105579.1 restriction endonuclease subunit S [Salmonella enterica subsp. enterica serovar Glostrup]EDV0467300.1 restriction endonuclease subunit S [Salmonella enterica subsp. enterica serovar Saintpaul]EAN8257680.1 restriction endonuclease subunit S [Salmonella enterica]EAT5020114.1 restriction endonuclease subunit S [Salmonella enterica]